MKHKSEITSDIKHNHNLDIFVQIWSPDKTPKALVFIIHGLGEHSSRYQYVAEKFAQENFLVYSFDLPGHGKTSGKRAFIKSFDMCNEIIDKKIQMLKKQYPNIPIIILGHSMGGSIAAYYALKLKPKIDGIILSSAALKISKDISPILIKLSGILGKILPTLPTIKLDSNGLSHNPEVVQKYNDDPLVFSGKIPVRTGAEINRSIKFNQNNASNFKYSILIIHGNQDKLADHHGSIEFYNKISSSNKTLKIYENLYHELMNEYEKDNIIADIIEWINKLITNN